MSSSKRKFSETDFCEDNESYSYGGDRKKKRGEIEKKRRDRINDCLNQLKELVPTACEKSNVNKLEKVEILQMAVDHLKSVHNNPETGGHGGRCAEHHGAGFRECMGEVSRYLVAVEGMHIEEPLRLRLMSHLHAFSATLRSGSSSYWSSGSYPGVSYAGSEGGEGGPGHHGYLVPVYTGAAGDKHPSRGQHAAARSCYADRTLSCYRPWGDSPAAGAGGLY